MAGTDIAGVRLKRKRSAGIAGSLILLSTGALLPRLAMADDADLWQFTLTPVLWNASVDAQLTDGNSGGGGFPIDPDYNFFSLDNLDDYLSLKFEASRENYGLLFDSLNAEYRDELSNRFFGFAVGTELGFSELALRYKVTQEHDLDLILGVRRVFLNIDYRLSRPLNPAIPESYHYSWTDPVFGLRYHYGIGGRWHAWFRGDVSAFDVSTQQVINLTADIQYRLSSWVSLSLGYRYFSIDFKQDDILYAVSLNGIQLGLGVHF